MNIIPVSRIAVLTLTAVVACGAVIAFGIAQVWHEAPRETATAAFVGPPQASLARDDRPTAPASAQADGNAFTANAFTAKASTAKAFTTEASTTEASNTEALNADLAISPAREALVPVFDVARIEPSGDAVIAGRAAPGATVELLRGGERHDQAVADQAGQFVIVPPRLPPGNYELTLRSTLPDGTLVQSQHGVSVALNAPPSTAPLQSHAELPAHAPVTSRAAQLVALAQPDDSTVTAALPDSAAIERKLPTRVVSRGDSLWRISRVTYGDGTRYAVVFKANRDQIRDPNRIYPGQIFILPAKAR
jgi:nucleoid-associated protein YgaU